jgi:hypothetical protein
LEEYSAHFMDRDILDRDLKYVYVPEEYNMFNYNYIIKKIYNLNKDRIIYFIGSEITFVNQLNEDEIISFDNMNKDVLLDTRISVKPQIEAININSRTQTESIQ